MGLGYLSVEYIRLGHLISSKIILGRDNIDVCIDIAILERIFGIVGKQ
jgi:hypothetical protein